MADSASSLTGLPWVTVGYQGVPMFRAHVWALEAARLRGCSFTVASADRRQGVAEKYGHQSQAALYAAFQNGTGNPANPPGYSSHELRSDGSACYRTSRGGKLPNYMLGIDATDAGQSDSCEHLVSTLQSMGIKAIRPYPDSRESHHFVITQPFGRIAWLQLVKLAGRHHSKRWAMLVRRGRKF
jgi:hypothetical protein